MCTEKFTPTYTPEQVRDLVENESLVSILIRRDGMTQDEATAMINDARLRVANGEDPEEILLEEFGLEPDYIFQLL